MERIRKSGVVFTTKAQSNKFDVTFGLQKWSGFAKVASSSLPKPKATSSTSLSACRNGADSQKWRRLHYQSPKQQVRRHFRPAEMERIRKSGVVFTTKAQSNKFD